MSGCAVCVYDLYEESMDAYLDAVMSLCSSLSCLKIPKSTWPPSIRRAAAQSSPSLPPTGSDRQRKEVVMSAFEELERALEAKLRVGEAKDDSAGR
jgi:Oxidoreductase-like protein, N-terminal